METIEEERWRLNPAFDAALFRDAVRKGLNYTVPQYINVPKYREEKWEQEWSVLEYLIQCLYCGTKKWKRKRNAQYCCDSCRVLASRQRKKSKKSNK